MPEPARSAVVVGGGIGGVTAALALAATGWRVTVLERSAVPGDAGSGISLWPNALRVLSLLGVEQDVLVHAAPLQVDSGLRRPDGRWLVRGAAAASPGVVLLHRAALHEVLRRALPRGALLTGADAERVVVGPAGAPATVDYRSAAGSCRASADLVVAADGLRSTIREQLWPRCPAPAYRGYTSWRAVTSPGALPVTGGGETWGRGRRFGYIPLTEGRVYWFAVANAPLGLRHGSALAEVRRHVGAWHDPIPRLLDATPPGDVLNLDIYDVPALPTYAAGRVALLGDAAHAMTPDLGQGACQAIEDAAVLAACVRDGADVPSGLRDYDARRRPRTQAIARAARRTGRFAQLEHPVAVALREVLLRGTPARVAARPLARITSWEPPALR